MYDYHPSTSPYPEGDDGAPLRGEAGFMSAYRSPTPKELGVGVALYREQWIPVEFRQSGWCVFARAIRPEEGPGCGWAVSLGVDAWRDDPRA